MIGQSGLIKNSHYLTIILLIFAIILSGCVTFYRGPDERDPNYFRVFDIEYLENRTIGPMGKPIENYKIPSEELTILHKNFDSNCNSMTARNEKYKIVYVERYEKNCRFGECIFELWISRGYMYERVRLEDNDNDGYIDYIDAKFEDEYFNMSI